MSTSPLPPTTSERPAARVSARRGFPWKRWVALVFVLALGVFVVFRVRSSMDGGGKRGRWRDLPPASVATAPAMKGDLRVYLSALGSVTPLNTVTVRSRAVGELVAIHFTEGQFVKSGDLLAEIDPRAYQVALEQAEGQLARDQALLENARRDLARYQSAEAAVTGQQVDAAKALVAQYEGSVRADQGLVDNDRLQLSYCRITAPITGRVGLKLVDQGNLIQNSDTTGIAVITQEQPMSVIFSLPEDDVPQVRRALAADRKLPVFAYDRAATELLATGEVAAIDNQIDAATGTVKLRALFPNEDHGLFPNQFVNVRLLIGTERDVTLVPNSAILIGAQTSSVFVVKPDNTVEQRMVKVGRSENDRTEIESGLAVGEIVAADGLDKLQDGTKINPRPVATETAGAASTPVADNDHRARAGAAAGR